MAEAASSHPSKSVVGPFVTRRGAARLHGGHALGLAAALLLPLAVLAPKGLSVLLPATALLGLGVHWHRHRYLPRVPATPALIVFGVVVWGAVSAAWSPRAGSSLSLSIELGVEFLSGLVALGLAMSLHEDERRAVERGAVIGLLAGLALLFGEWATSGFLSHAFGSLTGSAGVSFPTVLNRPATIVALGLWPAGLVLWKRSPWLGATVAAGAFALVAQTESMAALVALFAGAGVFVVARPWPAPTTAFVAATLTAGIVLAPALATYVLPPLTQIQMSHSVLASVYHRVRIWEFSAHEIAERPISGWGLNASRHIGETGAKLRLDREVAESDPRYQSLRQWFQGEEIDLMPLHPHNAPLQLWLELGVVGAALGSALILAAAAAVRRLSDRDVKAAWLAQITTALVLASISFGLWQAWWQGGLWLTAAFAAAIGRAKR